MLIEEDIDVSRELFGKPGERKFGFFERNFYFRIYRPFWCDKSDDLFDLFENKWNLIDYGNIVWGHVVQANMLLFEKGKANCPASIIFAPDPKINPSFEQLSTAAQGLYRLKNTTPDDENLRKIADTLTDEMERTFGVAIPEEFCKGGQLYEASTFITRKHLPNKVLSKGFFPILVSHCKPFWCVPLPCRYWPQALIEYWHAID